MTSSATDYAAPDAAFTRQRGAALSALDSEGKLIDRWCKLLVLNALHGIINELASQTPRRRHYGQWFIESERFTVLCDSIGLVPSVTRAAIEKRAVEMANRKNRRKNGLQDI